jgi:hypothetical protein
MLNAVTMKCLAIAFLILMTATSWGSQPENCPPPANLTTHNCSLPYNGISILAGIIGLPSTRSLLQAADLLDEVTSGTSDASCAPRLVDMTKKIQGDHKGCSKADIRDISEIIAAGNQDKVFCRRKPNTDAVDFDLYSEKQIRNYVIAQLHEQHPELCQ